MSSRVNGALLRHRGSNVPTGAPAHTELLKYFRSVTSNRWLMVKVFATMIIFFIVFVVFFA